MYAICHITGGGFYENLPRALADGCVARIEKAKLRTPAIFELIRKTGNISEHDMYNTFNMGVGMAVVVPAEHADEALAVLRENGEGCLFHGRSGRRRREGRRAMVNAAVLVSGGGTNLQALLDAQAAGRMPHVRIALVVASNPQAYALQRAAKAGVEAVVCARKAYESASAHDAALCGLLQSHGIDMVVLAGISL